MSGLLDAQGNPISLTPEKLLLSILEQVEKMEQIMNLMQQSALFQEMKINFLIKKVMDNKLISEEDLNSGWEEFRTQEINKIREKQSKILKESEEMNKQEENLRIKL